MSEKFAEIKQIPAGRFVKPCNILRRRSVSEEASPGREVSAWRAFRLGQRQAHTASFISPSHVVKDVKSGERVRKVVSERDLNALPL